MIQFLVALHTEISPGSKRQQCAISPSEQAVLKSDAFRKGSNTMNRNQYIQALKAVLLIAALFSSNFLMAQSCNPEIRKSAPDNRYKDNGDGTISDLQTGLMWQKCAIGQSGEDCAEGKAVAFQWDNAKQQDSNFNDKGGLAGHTDWRVPKIKELRGLVELSCWSPSINITFFPNTPDSNFWSSSPYSGYSRNAWYVSFANGSAAFNHANLKHYVRLVRTPK